MKKRFLLFVSAISLVLFLAACSGASSGGGQLTPENGVLKIDLASVSDGMAHHFTVKADDGTLVRFFALKSKDGVVRAAMDACDVCYRAGKGYYQEGDFMVCRNCGQKFASNRINEVKGGCNPAPLARQIEGKYLVIDMKTINANKWYSNFQPQS